MRTAEHIVIVGATSAIAEHCARLWIGTQASVVDLVGRDPVRLETIAADLRVRNPQATVRAITTDFTDPVAIGATIRGLASERAIDTALVAHGSLPDQAACQSDLTANRDGLVVNAVSPALFAEALVGVMTASGHGRLAVIGSVAGDRGRKSNYVYGAAKGLLDRYVEGLQHRLANTGVTVTLVKPGPTDTPMTVHMKAKGTKLAAVADVARAIVDGTARGRPVIYTPAKWALIMGVIRHLPRFVFNKMDI